MLHAVDSLTGYDGPAHMTEESHSASTAPSNGIIIGVVFTIVFGWLWVLSLLFCVTVRPCFQGVGGEGWC